MADNSDDTAYSYAHGQEPSNDIIDQLADLDPSDFLEHFSSDAQFAESEPSGHNYISDVSVTNHREEFVEEAMVNERPRTSTDDHSDKEQSLKAHHQPGISGIQHQGEAANGLTEYEHPHASANHDSNKDQLVGQSDAMDLDDEESDWIVENASDDEDDEEHDPDANVKEFDIKPGQYEVYENGAYVIKEGDGTEHNTSLPELSTRTADHYTTHTNAIMVKYATDNKLEWNVREDDLEENDRIPVDDNGASFAMEVSGPESANSINEIAEIYRDMPYFVDERIIYWRFGDFYKGQRNGKPNVEVRVIAEDKLNKLCRKHKKSRQQVLKNLSKSTRR